MKFTLLNIELSGRWQTFGTRPNNSTGRKSFKWNRISMISLFEKRKRKLFIFYLLYKVKRSLNQQNFRMFKWFISSSFISISKWSSWNSFWVWIQCTSNQNWTCMVLCSIFKKLICVGEWWIGTETIISF